MHVIPTPTAGGVVVFIAIWGALYGHLGPEGVAGFGGRMFWAAAAILLLGLADDIFDLKPGVKLLGQIVAALVFVVPEARAAAKSFLFETTAVSGFWVGFVSALWLVAMANIFNIIDGLDGLAGGVALIAAIPLFALAWWQGHVEAALISAALIGAVLGFLRYNAHPARLFLGDTGGMLLGFVVGIVSLHIMDIGPSATVSPAIVLLIVAVPMFDTFFAVVRRWSRGEPLARADAMHIHHQLLKHGFTTPQAVGRLYALGATAAVAALVLAGRDHWYGWVALAVASALAIPWAWRLGVIGAASSDAPGAFIDGERDTRPSRLTASESVDFREETGKFRGIAK